MFNKLLTTLFLTSSFYSINFVVASESQAYKRWYFELPAGNLGETLRHISKQTGVLFSYETQKLKALESPVTAIQRYLTLEELMQHLLAHSNIEYVYDGVSTVVLRIKKQTVSQIKAPTDEETAEEIIVLGAPGSSKALRLNAATVITSVRTDFLPKGTDLLNSSLLILPGVLVNGSDNLLNVNRTTRNISVRGVYEDGLPLLYHSLFNFGSIEEYLRLDESIGHFEMKRGGASAVLIDNGPGMVIDLLGKHALNRQSGKKYNAGRVKVTHFDYGMNRSDLYYRHAFSENWYTYAGGYYRESNGLPGAEEETIGDRGGQFTLGLHRELGDGELMLKYRNMEERNPFLIESNDFLIDTQEGINIKMEYLTFGIDLNLGDWDYQQNIRYTKANTDMNLGVKRVLDAPVSTLSVANLGEFFNLPSSSLSAILNIPESILQNLNVPDLPPTLVANCPLESDDDKTLAILSGELQKPVDYLVQDTQFKTKKNKHSLIFGIYADKQKSDGFRYTQSGHDGGREDAYEIKNFALYFLDGWQLTDTLRVDIGFRTTRTRYEANGFIYNPCVLLNNQNRSYSKSKHAHVTNYTFGTNYALNTNTSLQAYYSQGTRKINIDLMLFSDIEPKPEGFKVLELGYRQYTDKLDVSTRIYRTESDEVEYTEYAGFYNLAGESFSPERESYGFDAEVLYRPLGTENVELSFYLGLSDSDFYQQSSGNEQLGHKPTGSNPNNNIVNEKLRQFRISPFYHRPWGNIYLNYSYVHNEIRYVNAKKFSPDYSIIDLGLLYKINKHFDLHIVGRNVNNETTLTRGGLEQSDYEDQGDASFFPLTKERSFEISVSYKIN